MKERPFGEKISPDDEEVSPYPPSPIQH